MPFPVTALESFTAVVITGGSSGIGKSFIELISKYCPGIAICNLSRSKPELNKFPEKWYHVPCDLTQPQQIDSALASVIAWLESDGGGGKVLLINNSGFGTYGRFPQPDMREQLEMIDLNVRGVVHMTAGLLGAIRTRGGAVMNIASAAAFQPTPYLATYGATKTFVLQWSLALGAELRDSGVHVMSVCPGPIPTNFFKRARLKQGAASGKVSLTSEDVVDTALRALARGKAYVVPGWRMRLVVLASSLGPRAWVAKVAARVLEKYRLSQIAP